MKNPFFIILIILITHTFSYSQEKKVKIEGVTYLVNLYSKTAKVGNNYTQFKKGKVEGDVIIKPSVVFKKKEYPVTSFDESAFAFCAITSITLPNSIQNFNAQISGSKTLKEIIVSDDNPYFSTVNGVLYNKEMTEILRFPIAKQEESFVLPSTVLTIGTNSFAGCSKLNSIQISNKTTTIKENAFWDCELKNIEIPEGVEVIGENAFEFSSLVSIKLPYSLKEIGEGILRYCSNLEYVVYKNKKIKFPENTFEHCTKLTKNKIVYEAPLEILIQLANKGNMQDQYELANCYLTGEGKVAIDTKKSMEWFLKAANQGHVLSQKKLGDIYLSEKNIKESLKWYTLASTNGNSDAQYILGNFYFYGKNVKLDYSKAYEYYKQSANQGNNKAEEALGVFYYFGFGKIKQDYKEAIHWFSLSAEKENPMSAYYLATCYYDGLGCTKNDALALRWSEKALEGEINEALPMFCTLAYNDAVIKMDSKSYTPAITQFSKLLKYNDKHVDSYINRGYCYLQLAKKDWASAEQDFKKALALDKTNEVAKNNLDVVNEHYRIVKEAGALDDIAYSYYLRKDYVSTITYCSKSISLYNENPYPYYLIGNCFNDNKLYDDAIKFYNKALEVDPNYKQARTAIKFALAQQILEAISNVVIAIDNTLNKTYTSNLTTNQTIRSDIPKNSTTYNSAKGKSTFNCYAATRDYETQRGYARTHFNQLNDLRTNDEIYGTIGRDYASRPNAALNISTANALKSIQNYMKFIRENALKNGCVIPKAIEESLK